MSWQHTSQQGHRQALALLRPKRWGEKRPLADDGSDKTKNGMAWQKYFCIYERFLVCSGPTPHRTRSIRIRVAFLQAFFEAKNLGSTSIILCQRQRLEVRFPRSCAIAIVCRAILGYYTVGAFIQLTGNVVGTGQTHFIMPSLEA